MFTNIIPNRINYLFFRSSHSKYFYKHAKLYPKVLYLISAALSKSNFEGKGLTWQWVAWVALIVRKLCRLSNFTCKQALPHVTPFFYSNEFLYIRAQYAAIAPPLLYPLLHNWPTCTIKRVHSLFPLYNGCSFTFTLAKQSIEFPAFSWTDEFCHLSLPFHFAGYFCESINVHVQRNPFGGVLLGLELLCRRRYSPFPF